MKETTFLEKGNNMVIARLYVLKQEAKNYIANKRGDLKHSGPLHLGFTKDKERAMVFSTTESLVMFGQALKDGDIVISNKYKAKLKIERETIDKSFEEVYGKDPIPAEERVAEMNRLAKIDQALARIKQVQTNLKTLRAIDLKPLTQEEKVEVLEIIAENEKEETSLKKFYSDLENRREEE